MSSTAETEPTSSATSQAPPWQGFRLAALGVAAALAFFGIVLLAYELAIARVPQHRAALERLVRAQTGLDIRFDELGLRWGWYGPEAVFRRVELGEPGRSTVLLRAPELVVGFDIWQSVRSGQLEAGRITLVAADIDFGRPALGAGAPHTPSGISRRPEALQVLERWQGGRVDLEGGTLRVPDPSGAPSPLVLQIRRASLRRSTSEWSGYGLVFLPERLGRTARVALRLEGNLEKPAELSGSLRFEGRRLAFAGWRDTLGSLRDAQRYLPRAGGGDIALDVEFSAGRLIKASGRVSAGGLELAAGDEPHSSVKLDHVKGEWRLANRATTWRLQVDSLELARPTESLSSWSTGVPPGSLSLEAAAGGGWLRGTLDQAPLQPVVAAARWFAPQLDLSAAGVGGTVRSVVFDWSTGRPSGHRLRASARLADIAIKPTSNDFSLTGLAGQVSGDETTLVTELNSRAARLELAQAPQYPLNEVQVEARLQIDLDASAWRIATEKLELHHGKARLKVAGALAGDANVVPEIDARAELEGVDIPLLQRLAGDSMSRTFGATFAQVTAGDIDSAQIELHGPLDGSLPATGLTGEIALKGAVLSAGDPWPEVRDVSVRVDWRGSRIRAVLDGARLQAVAGIPSIDALHGTLIFDGGSLRRSTLSGTWLGGPVTLNVRERRERGVSTLAMLGHGVLDARQLALLATAGTSIDQAQAPTGRAEWSGELSYLAGSEGVSSGGGPAQWRVKADSALMGIESHLPQPLAKTGAAVLPLHVEAQGTAAAAELRLSLGDGLHSLISLQRRDDATWRVARGKVRFGMRAPMSLPATPVVLVEGRIDQLDLPAYVAAWQQLRAEPMAPTIRADLVAAEMLVAGHSYSEVAVTAERTDAGADLRLQSPEILGTAHWPAVSGASHPAQFHFARLNVPDGAAFAASAELIAALGPATELSVDDIIWAGHSIGSAAATIESGGNAVNISDLHLTGRTQEVSGTMRCQNTACRLKFTLDSTNAAATLEDFGFRPDLTAAKATLDGDLEWRVGAHQPPLQTLVGRIDLRLQDGTTRSDPDPSPQGTPFPLLLVPALVNGMGQPSTQAASLASSSEPQGLRFSSLEAGFEVSHGEATTSNLHFDGDAEILMRGRTSLVARDYDQQVWILRGQGRLPAAVRRLGPTPRVAAAWLSLRELFTGSGRDEGSKAQLHLQGTWDDPIVVAAE
ncbi:MAG TPA: AsmA-like C-terminal region-containing protein [Steroidobacteraceae bacterium]